jgi:hypothetical protein
MLDRSKTATTMHTDMVIGRVERTRTTLTLTAQGQPPRNTKEVVAAQSAAIAALSA